MARGSSEGTSDVDIDMGHLARAVWRRKFTVLLTGVAFAGAAFFGSSLISPSYKSDTRIYVESRESTFTRTDGGPGGGQDSSLSPESVESQVSLITSAEILGVVADRFKLGERAEFAPQPSFIDRLISDIRPEADAPTTEVIEAVRKHLNVYRVENTRVLVIEFSSHDPVLARDVPNAIADEYLTRQKGALLSSNTNATGWLESEIADLREAVKAAEAKVAAFRARSNLLVGDNQAVLATQQLSEITSELSRTRAARAAAEGRAQSIRDAMERGRALDTVADVLSSPTVQALRERQVALKSQIADLSTTLLDNHPRLRSLRSQARDLDTEIAGEARKVQASLETEADSARQREAALTAEMDRLKGDAASAGEQEVELRSLEREAQAQSQLLESYLTRYRAAVARGSRDYLPVDARVFSEAGLPGEPYFPKVLPITISAGVGGLLAAVLAILVAELFSGRALRPAAGAVEEEEAEAPIAVEPRSEDGEPAQPLLAVSPSELAGMIAAMRLRRVMILGERPAAAEGGVALARRLAAEDAAPVLLDLDPAGPAARRMGVREAGPALSELAAEPALFGSAIHRDRASAAQVLRAVPGENDSGEGDDTATMVLDALSEAYGCIVMPCGGHDVGEVAAFIDGETALVIAVGEDADEAARLEESLRSAGYSDMVFMYADMEHLSRQAA